MGASARAADRAATGVSQEKADALVVVAVAAVAEATAAAEVMGMGKTVALAEGSVVAAKGSTRRMHGKHICCSAP